MQKINSGVTAPKGFIAGGLHCGVKNSNTTKKDLAMIYSEVPCNAAAVYTQNKVYGAPITVTRNNIADGMAQAMVCNSGNANTCNADGVEKAEKMCVLTAAALGLKPEDYDFYLDLRKYGSARHAGFGLGFERCVMYLTGMGNIRDVLPFPRTVNNCEL